MLTPADERQRLDAIVSQLDLDWAEVESDLREVRDFILPERGKFLEERQQSRRKRARRARIINTHATHAAKTSAAGLVSGLTKPSMPWFGLTTSQPAVAEQPEVKAWLDEATERLRRVFVMSNLYTSLPLLYLDALVFGTGAMTVQRHPTRVMHTFVHPIGSYRLGQDDDGRPNVFHTCREMAVWEIAERFGRANLPTSWRDALTSEDGKNRLRRYEVRQTIYPNPNFIAGALESKHKRWRQVFWCTDQSAKDVGGILHTSGFDQFPIIVARWTRNGNLSPYGDGPGQGVLPDVQMLQQMEAKTLSAADKMVDPPLQGPAELEGIGVSLRPGRYTPISEDARRQGGVSELHRVQFDISAVELKVQQVMARIDRTFQVDLFRVLAENRQGPQSTAYEIEQLIAERDTQLGPVLETLSDDTLDPLVELGYAIVDDARMIPPPPPAVANQPLRIEYLSIVARAQKLVATRSLQQFTGFITNAAQAMGDPTILDRLDADGLADTAADWFGAPARILRSVDDAEPIREQRRAAQAQAAAAEQAAQTAATAQHLGATDPQAMTETLSRLTAAAAN